MLMLTLILLKKIEIIMRKGCSIVGGVSIVKLLDWGEIRNPSLNA